MKIRWTLIGVIFFLVISFFLSITRQVEDSRDLAVVEDKNSKESSHDLASQSGSPNESSPSDQETSSNDTSSRTISSKGDKEFKKAFSKKYSSDWTFQETKQGNVFRIMGGKIDSIGNSPQAIEGLARNLASFSGVTDQIFNYTSKKETNLSTTHFVAQFFSGYEVYDAWVQATSNKKGDVFIVENFTKNVEKDISTEIELTQNQALQIVAREYEEGADIKGVAATPKIWADDSPHELVWEFSVLVKTPFLASYKVLVGAQSGNIRERFKVSKN